MTTKKMKMKGTSYIDEQILSDILSRLPLKSLVRFKCVCKFWKSFIEQDQWFISKPISKSPRLLIMNPLMLFPRDENLKFESCRTTNTNLCKATNHKKITTATTTIQAISNKKLLACKQVQNPINGMICLTDKPKGHGRIKEDNAACLYNVITKEATPWIRSTYLAQVEKWCDLSDVHVSRTYEFGFDPTTKEYKVICIWSISGWELQKFEGYGEYTISDDNDDGDEGYEGCYKMCEILTLGKDTAWRRIDKVPPSVKELKDEYGSVYVNGSIYWIIFEDQHHKLVAFNVGSEEYRVIPDLDLLDLRGRSSFHLIDMDGHLAIEHEAGNHTINLWILDEDGGKNTSTRNTSNIKWTKEIIMLPPCWSDQNVELHVVKGREYLTYEDVVFLHSYNPKKKIFSKIEITGDESPYTSLVANIGHPSYKFTTYVESSFDPPEEL